MRYTKILIRLKLPLYYLLINSKRSNHFSQSTQKHCFKFYTIEFEKLKIITFFGKSKF